MKTQEIIEEVRQLKERLALLENQLKESQEELKEKYVPWIPEFDKKFFYINAYGEVDDSKIFYRPEVINLSENHNLFKTKELAEERKLLSPLERKLAFILDQLGRDESEIDLNNGITSYFISYGYTPNGWKVNPIALDRNQVRHKSQYATSLDMIRKAIELMGDDAYRYCGVELPN